MSDKNTNENDNRNEEPVPGSDEYNEKMAARFDQGTGTPDEPDRVDAPEMPDGGFEKFYNKETGEYDWASHAKELQYKLDQKSKDETDSGDDSDDDDDEVNDIIKKAGYDRDALRDMLIEKGELDPEAKKAFMDQGIPEWMIDEHVELAKAAMQNAQRNALEYAGGEDEWNSISEWADENLSEGEKKRYNELLAGPEEDWKTAIDTLKTKMGKATGSKESRLRSGDVAGGDVVGYQSKAEWMADINNEKYKTDPAFRARVMRKLQVSTFPADNEQGIV